MDAAKSTKSQADKVLSVIMLPQEKKKKNHSYHMNRDNLHTTTTLGSLDNVNIVSLNQLLFVLHADVR